MRKIIAEQLLFSRVEAEYSPKSRSGYQIVFKSDRIPEEVATEIEKRVQCFRGADATNGQRLQYFTVSDWIVLALSCHLSEIDTTITDRNGRTGAFIAHCLVVDQAEFAKIDNDPFYVFGVDDLGAFFVMDDAKRMVEIQQAKKNKQTLQLPTREDPSKTLFATDIEVWTEENFENLWLMGANASEITSEGRSVFFQASSPELIMQIVNLIHYSLTMELRLDATFDLFVDGCRPMPGDIWLLGGERTLRNRKIIQVDLERGEVEKLSLQEGVFLDPKASLYAKWLKAFTEEYSVSQAIPYIPTVQTMSRAFEQQSLTTTEPLNTVALESFYHINDEEVQAGLAEAFSPHLPDDIYKDIKPHLLELLGGYQPVLEIAATRTFREPITLAECLYRWIVDYKPEVKRWSALKRVAMASKHDRLLLLITLLNPPHFLVRLFRSPLGKHGQASVQKLEKTPQFDRFLDDATQLQLPIYHLVTESNVEKIVDFFVYSGRFNDLQQEEQYNLLIAIIEEGEGELVGKYSRIVPHLSQKQIESLSAAIEKYGAAHDLQVAVDNKMKNKDKV